MATKQTFEKAMKQLEQIVQELESSDLPLEKAIIKFEEGIRLSRFCSEKLDETEKNADQQDQCDQHRQPVTVQARKAFRHERAGLYCQEHVLSI